MLDNLFKLIQNSMPTMTRKRETSSDFNLLGQHCIEHWRNGKLLNKYKFLNDIVNEGKNDIFNVYFHDSTATASTSWFIGLISNTSYSGLAAGDVMNSHAGWQEFTSYTESTRVAWGPGAAASQSITNATPAQFDINASGTVKGVFITTVSTKGGTTGKLWATALFSADVPVSNGDQLKSTYTLSA